MTKKTNKVFMAVATGKVSTDAPVVKRYIGIAPVKVLAICPTKAELEKIYPNRDIDAEPTYVGEEEVDGQKIETARIDFIVEYKSKESDDSFISKISFFLKNKVTKSTSGKIQIIDKYGATAWVTPAEFEAKSIPMYSNGPANIDPDYRACYPGEEYLTSFLKEYLVIPNRLMYKNKAWVANTTVDPAECEVRLDHIADYFKGNFAEIRAVATFQPNNEVKVMFGIKTTDEGKQYQDVFMQKFLRNSASNYSYIDAALQERKQAGGYSHTEFEAVAVHEYVVAPTTFAKDSSKEALPFDAPETPNW